MRAMPALRVCVIAKFHYTGPTGPDRTGPDETKSADFVGDPHLVGSGRVRVVEFSYYFAYYWPDDLY